MDPRLPSLLLALLALLALTHSVSSVRLAQDFRVAVRVLFKAEYDAVECHLCTASSCSSLSLWGRDAAGALWYGAWTGCNARGGDCSTLASWDEPNGASDIPTGELAVWLAGHGDEAVAVAVPEGSGLLRVRPQDWANGMPVELIVPPARLVQGDVVTVRAQFKERHAAVDFYLHGGSRYSVIRAACSDDAGAIRYMASSVCEEGYYKNFPSPAVCSQRCARCTYLPDGELVFSVELRAGELAVWLPGHADKVVTVDVPAGGNLL